MSKENTVGGRARETRAVSTEESRGLYTTSKREVSGERVNGCREKRQIRKNEKYRIDIIVKKSLLKGLKGLIQSTGHCVRLP